MATIDVGIGTWPGTSGRRFIGALQPGSDWRWGDGGRERHAKNNPQLNDMRVPLFAFFLICHGARHSD